MAEKAKILFVDDERRILTSLKMIFRTDYQVFTANSGAEALEIIRQERIQAIISDQRMPEMLGHELLREVKQISPNTMRLLLTGYSDLAAIMSSINDGEVFRFIHKPWNVDEIRAIVASAVRIADNTMSKLDIIAAEQNNLADVTTQNSKVLVIDDDDKRVTQSQIQALYPKLTVYTACDIDQALEILNHEEIAILLTDTIVGGQDTTDFVKLLKQQYPFVMTIVLTETVDSDVAIELINQGQIYRYLRRPVGDNALRISIEHGLFFYAKNKQNPELLQRHQVEPLRSARNPSLVAKITSRLQSLRKRLHFCLDTVHIRL